MTDSNVEPAAGQFEDDGDGGRTFTASNGGEHGTDEKGMRILVSYFEDYLAGRVQGEAGNGLGGDDEDWDDAPTSEADYQRKVAELKNLCRLLREDLQVALELIEVAAKEQESIWKESMRAPAQA